MTEEILRIRLSELTGVIRLRLEGARTVEFDDLDTARLYCKTNQDGIMEDDECRDLVALLDAIDKCQKLRFKVEFTLPVGGK